MRALPKEARVKVVGGEGVCVSRVFGVAAFAALLFLVAVPSGLAQPGPATTYTDSTGDAGAAPDVAKVSVSYDQEPGAGFFVIATTFTTPFTGQSRYSLYFDTDRNSKTGSTGGAEYRFRIFPNGDFAWARWEGQSGWVWKPGGVTESPSPQADPKSLVFSISKSDIGGATSFRFYVISYQTATDDEDDAPSYPLEWPYPASAAWLHDQTTATHALLQASDLRSGWQLVPTDPGSPCNSATQPTAIALQLFEKVASPDTNASSMVFTYATRLQARRAFSNLQSELRSCLTAGLARADRNKLAFRPYRVVMGVPAAGVALALHTAHSASYSHYSYALSGRAIVFFNQSATGRNLPFSEVGEAAMLRLMTSRLSR